MASKFKIPTLAEIIYEYLGLHNKRAREKDFQRLQDAFVKRLTRIGKEEDIRAALALDTARHLPIQMKSPAYERLLSISGRSPELLREYAQELYDSGPEFAYYADQLWAEAKQLDGQSK